MKKDFLFNSKSVFYHKIYQFVMATEDSIS